MELSPIETESRADVLRTETFQNTIARANPDRINNLPPEERSRARQTGAMVLGFTEVLMVLTDLQRNKRRDDHRPPARLYWLGDAHAWSFN